MHTNIFGAKMKGLGNIEITKSNCQIDVWFENAKFTINVQRHKMLKKM